MRRLRDTSATRPRRVPQATLASLDTDGSGGIDFDEFCAAASPLYASSAVALRAAFDFFDADGSGDIDRQELRTILDRLGGSTRKNHDRSETERAVDQVFAAADADADGRVSFPEFISIFTEVFAPSAK